MTLLLRFVPVLVAAIFVVHARAQDSAPWQSLFNGENLDGWSLIDPPVKAAVKDGNLVLKPTPHTVRHAYVRTNATYQDFILELEFKRDRRLDGSVVFRAVDAPDTAFTALFGYLIKIDNKGDRRWTGGLLVDFGNSFSWLQTLEDNEPGRQAEKPSGAWNRLRIEAIGQQIKVWVNGIPTVHVRDEKYSAGYIAFKIHFVDNDGAALKDLEAAYRDIRVITDNPQRYATPTSLPLKDTRGELKLTTFR
jgi:Domain of Unknown Function (DUF1080)